MTDFWQHFQLRLDPWGAEYEAPVGLEGEGATVEPVDATVEVAGPWSPLAVPADLALPDVLLFIDGRRRLDARLVGRDGDGPLYGAFATIAVGAVRVDRRARLATCVVPPVLRSSSASARPAMRVTSRRTAAITPLVRSSARSTAGSPSLPTSSSAPRWARPLRTTAWSSRA